MAPFSCGSNSNKSQVNPSADEDHIGTKTDDNFNSLENLTWTARSWWRKIRWKNNPPPSHLAYLPTKVEHLANVLTHGVYILPIIWSSYDLFEKAGVGRQKAVSLLYGSCLVGLFSVSTLFHAVCYSGTRPRLRVFLHRCDRAMIYIFIAGAYTPWLMLKNYPVNAWGESFRWAIWLIAASGIFYQQVFYEKYKRLETFFYILTAVLPGLCVTTSSSFDNGAGLYELRLGGLIYLMGVIFFKLDGRLPLAHAIWHLHVVCATQVHLDAVKKHLIVAPDTEYQEGILSSHLL